MIHHYQNISHNDCHLPYTVHQPLQKKSVIWVINIYNNYIIRRRFCTFFRISFFSTKVSENHHGKYIRQVITYNAFTYVLQLSPTMQKLIIQVICHVGLSQRPKYGLQGPNIVSYELNMVSRDLPHIPLHLPHKLNI